MPNWNVPIRNLRITAYKLNYLQTMLNLPWGIYTTDNLNLKNAEKTLNKDHYGLEKVKSVCMPKVAETETPLFEDLHTIGTVAKIVRVLEMPDQTTTVILQGPNVWN